VCAFDSGGLKTPLVGGVFTDGCPAAFREACSANGLLDHLDAVSFHNYRPASSIQGLVAAHRAWLKEAGKEAMPLWITESGRPWKRGPSRPPLAEDAASAVDITMQTVEARACGAARHFPFVYPYYEENQNNFGMMGKEGTPLRAMAAYARCVSVLSGARYIGDLRVDDPAVKRARVFEANGRAIAVLYTGQPKPGATVKAAIPAEHVEGIDGRVLKAAGDDIPGPDGLAYVWADRAKVAGLILTDTPAAAMCEAARKGGVLRGKPPTIVLQYLADPNTARPSKMGYVPVSGDANGFPVRVRVTNLSGEIRKGSLTVGPRGKEAPASGATAFEVAGGAFADLDTRVDLTKFLDRRARAMLEFGADCGPGNAPSRLTIRVLPVLTLEALLAMFPVRKALDVRDLKCWTKNIVGDGQMEMSAPEGAWRLAVKFDKGDPWAYPHFNLPKDAPLPPAKGLVIRARCQGDATVRVMLYRHPGHSAMTGYGIIPADGKWHAALVLFEDLGPALPADARDDKGNTDLSKFDSIQVGLNSRSKDKQNVLEVSDLYLVGE
jgi:hypothetical protein